MNEQQTKQDESAQRAVGSNVGLGLLPCPFCGHLPRLKIGKVKCVNIMCKVQPKIASWYAPGYDDKAIADWNKRDA